MKRFHERLQHIAYAKKKEQKDIVSALGKHKSTVSKWWLGKIEPGRANTRLLAEYLGCDYIWLLSGEGEPFPDAKGKIVPIKERYSDQAHQDIADWIKEQDGTINYWEILKGKLALENPEFKKWLKKRATKSDTTTLTEDKSVNGD